ncbi:MAG: LCP family protein, partial [Clostridiales bacterium]|nr:LCP family protein [Clostridiales bacterium]
DEKGINPTKMDFEDVYSGNPINNPMQKNIRDYNYGGNNGHGNTSGKSHNEKSKVKSKGSAAKKITAVLAVLIALVLLSVILVEPVLAKINYSDKIENPYISESELFSSSKVKNILIMGVDARSNQDNETSRADTMMLLSIDKEHKCIKLTSFLRDTWIYIPPADKKQRLNAACTYGGYQGVVDTIEYNFGIKIDGYAVADFEMFKTMVDSIGGVEVEVTQKEADEVTNHPSRYGNVTLDSGTHTLTGEQALAYCRIRKIDTDWKRTERQRTVIEAILKGAVKSGPVSLYKMANSVAQYVETDLSKSELKSIVLSAVSCISGGFKQASCPFEDTWQYENKGGASVITMNLEKNKEKLKSFIYDEA